MSLPEKIGIESHLMAILPAALRAKFRIDEGSVTGDPARFPGGNWVDVVVAARLYRYADVQGRGTLPDVPWAQGPDVPGKARKEWTVIDLPLPWVEPGRYAVVAKVHSADNEYRRAFDPSRCLAYVVELRPAAAAPRG
jgi:hypothetical protein